MQFLQQSKAVEPLLTAGEAWKDQNNIARLLSSPKRVTCKDRIYPVNDKYGFGRCIKHFAGLPEEASLPGVVPHGAGTYGRLSQAAQAPKQELLKKAPCIFASNDRCFDAFWNSGKRYIFPIGLASIYAHACLQEETINSKGSLFFRIHSTHSLIDQLNDSEVIKWLFSLPKKYHPIRISAFPFDWSRGIYKPYAEAGFKIVSAGSEYDQDFIWRHLHLIRGHQRILSTGMGTHIFHAVMCGKPVIIKQFHNNYRLTNKHFNYDQVAAHEFQNLGSIFKEELNEPSAAQVSLTRNFLGLDHTLPPPALRSIIGLAQRIHDSHHQIPPGQAITSKKQITR